MSITCKYTAAGYIIYMGICHVVREDVLVTLMHGTRHQVFCILEKTMQRTYVGTKLRENKYMHKLGKYHVEAEIPTLRR